MYCLELHGFDTSDCYSYVSKNKKKKLKQFSVVLKGRQSPIKYA